MSIRKASFLGLISIFLAALAAASDAIPNWPAPAVWTSPAARGLTTLSVSNPLPFIALTPCRVADTRGNGFTGQYGPPGLVANATRSFTITGVCGIPAGAAAVSFNFAALNVGGGGDLRVFPAGAGVPLVSTMNYNGNTPNIANAAVVPLGTGGAITVQADAVPVDLIIDVNGFYTQSSASASFEWDTAGPVGIVGSSNATTGESFGVVGLISSSTTGSAGVSGTSSATTGATYGVMGSTGSIAANAAGVFGVDGSGLPAASVFLSAGVLGESGTYAGVLGASGDFGGVIGARFDTLGNLYTLGFVGEGGTGVHGIIQQALETDEAGVRGVDATGLAGGSGKPSSGVRGESKTNVGVLGQGQAESILGELLNSTGASVLASGALGFTPDGGTTKWGVFANGNVGASGTKPFIEAHPTDASREIRYVALEGPEAGTYFRGRARFSHGLARIAVPESFRLVTDEEGLTVQITPIGEMASYAVTQVGLDEIVVQGSKDVEFFYTVNGVRQTFKDWEVISASSDYMPRSVDARMPESLSPEQKRRLIANGTYNADGTVNMQTAERVGWTRVWKDREEREKAAVAEAQAKDAANPRGHGRLLSRKPSEP